ncbi:TlyA family RNA methyltransferase [Amaricoccus macauensis]|uniref:TlyA family RNA methyltransferase n=1 Tax=Amaricoccus macauensis TaxID=57001 RepID=UPI003C7E6E97
MPRLDQALVEAGLAESRARAQALIAAGVVEIDGRPAAKPAQKVGPDSRVRLTEDPLPYVSRAALKLKHALDTFGLDPGGAGALDLGASTGGFTQVLLEAGAAQVWAIDVGHGQLHKKLRGDPRVQVIEGLNVRDLTPEQVPPPDWIVSDLSFISLEKALPPALDMAGPGATLVCLVKPQFEVGRAHVGKGGIVRDHGAIEAARERIRRFIERSGWTVIGECESPIRGGDGNVEFLLAAHKSTPDR